ncbi:MAG: PspA/IM30 family protein [Sedimentisphaerales bacterium]|nr:PspA/IM30 family protein [Sedimentisphaerales bacterium]
MGLFRRLHRITMGRIEAFLDRAEDPEIIFPILLEEMEKQLRAATEAEAKAAASLKQAQRELKAHQNKVDRFGQGAALALKKSDEQTARMSIEAQIDAEKMASVAQQNADMATDSLDHATAARKRIQQQLDELHAKKDELLTRARVAKTQQKIQRTVSGSAGSTGSILDAVARLEAGVEEAEAQLEIQSHLAGEGSGNATLERKLSELAHDSEIEKRMEQLRKQLSPA